MRSFRSKLLVLLVAPFFAAAVASSLSNDDRGAQQQQQQCGLYLAPSSQSTKSEFKWGTYVGNAPLKAGDVIGKSPNLAINLHDFTANNQDE